LTDVISGSALLPAALAQLLLKGNEVGKTFRFDNFRFSSWWLRAYSVSYANDVTKYILNTDTSWIKKISAGATLKLYNGFAYTSIDEVHSYFHTGEKNALTGQLNGIAYSSFSNDFAVRYDFDTTTPIYNLNYFSKPAAAGFGIDIGALFELEGGWRLGVALTDLGVINWYGNAAQHTAHGDVYIDDIFDEHRLDSLLDLVKIDSRRLGAFSTPPPTAIRIGISTELSRKIESIPGTLLVAFDYNQGLNDMPSNSTVPRISLGALWQPIDYLPYIESGVTYDQSGHFRWAMGLGYSSGFFAINIATLDILSALSPNYFTPHASFAFGMSWKVLY
jgi:hypothetical protein